MKNLTGQYCFTHSSGEDIYLFTLFNERGTTVGITNYGATICSFKLMEPDGTYNDIVLGFDKVEDYFSPTYLEGYPYFGCIVGRYANRIKNGHFKIDDQEFQVAKNKGGDHLHGGLEGFDKKIWQFVSASDTHLRLRCLSPDGEEGYPGNLSVEIHFELTENDELQYEFFAEADRATAVNLTHHSYFNLHNGQGKIDNHIIRIASDRILEQDDNFVVTGKEIPVAGTRYDFTQPKPVGRDWIAEDGYDQSFVLHETNGELQLAAEVQSENADLSLQVYTTEPLVHFYTGKWIPPIKGKNDTSYGPYSGLCLETQKHPNAVNIPHFPNTILRPGETYRTKTVYKIIR